MTDVFGSDVTAPHSLTDPIRTTLNIILLLHWRVVFAVDARKLARLGRCSGSPCFALLEVDDVPRRSGASRPPLLGEHTGELLGELGYSAAMIAELREREVI